MGGRGRDEIRDGIEARGREEQYPLVISKLNCNY